MILTALCLAIKGLGDRKYVLAAACLFGLAPGTEDLDRDERRCLARQYRGGSKKTFYRKHQYSLTDEIAMKLTTIFDERFAGGKRRNVMSKREIAEAFATARVSDPTRQVSVSANPTTSTEPAFTIDLASYFDPSIVGKEHIARELSTTTGEPTSTWWHPGSSGWFGSFFAFWHMTLTTPCEDIHYEYDQGTYDSTKFGVDAPDGDNPKAVVVTADPFVSDNPRKALHCGITNWNFCHGWAETHSEVLFASSAQPSVFGLMDRLAYPGLASVHVLLYTSDGYILFAQRSSRPHVALLPDAWSISFEEQVSLTPREHTPRIPRDATVLDTIRGGIQEEWGLPPSTIETSSCLALGREYIEVANPEPRLILNFGIITAVVLSVDLATVWSHLDNAPRIRDRTEHQAWLGCRFKKTEDVRKLLQAIRPSARSDQRTIWDIDPSIKPELDTYEGGRPLNRIKDRGVTPTSAVRLLLGMNWLTGRAV